MHDEWWRWHKSLPANINAWPANADRGDLKVFHINCAAVHPFTTLQLIITVGCIKIRPGVRWPRSFYACPFDVAGDPVLDPLHTGDPIHCTGHGDHEAGSSVLCFLHNAHIDSQTLNSTGTNMLPMMMVSDQMVAPVRT